MPELGELRDPFLIGLPSTVVGCVVQDNSILRFLETTHATKVTHGFSRSFSFGLSTSRDPLVTSPLRLSHVRLVQGIQPSCL